MLENFFSQVIHMSLTASVVILIVLVARMFLNKIPKVFLYILWAIVLFRLLSPVSISSAVSIFTVMDMAVAEECIIEEMPEESFEKQVIIPENSETLDSQPNSMKIYPAVNVVQKQSLSEKIRGCLPYIWLTGIACIALENLIQLRKLRKKMVGAVCLQGNLYLSDYITEPFVIGLIRPRIYLPSNIEEKEQAYIILHEQVHIKRLDHITRSMAFVALCIHWFNPLVWLAFRLSAKDMEMSCDEAVMNTLEEDIRSEYAQSLLNFATGHRKAAAMPLTFGESDTKSRIKNVMNWKKPAIWGSISAVICMIVLGIMLMTDSKQQEDVEIAKEENMDLTEDTELTDPKQNVEESTELSDDAKRLFYSQWKVTGVAGTTTEYEESAFEADSMIEQAVGSVVWGNHEQLCIYVEGNSEDAVVIVDENPKVNERLINSAQFEQEWGINPKNILLYEDEFIEIEVLTDGNFPGGKAYFAGDKNAIIYFESVFFSAELVQTEATQTEEDYYKIATSLSASEVEQFAMDVKNDILSNDWESLSEKIVYPIVISGTTIEGQSELLKLDIKENLNQEFIDAVENETCEKMFCNWQGISMGATGQIWIGSVYDEKGEIQLKIIGINGMLDKLPAGEAEKVRESHATISLMIEGVAEEVPATLYTGSNYSIYVPDEGWQMFGPEGWSLNVNEKVQFWIADYTGKSVEAVKEQLAKDGYKEDQGLLTKYDKDSEVTRMVKIMENNGAVIGIFYCYPVDATEGFGTRLNAIVNTFMWLT